MTVTRERVTRRPPTQEVSSPMPHKNSKYSAPERFFAKVKFTDTCWLWTAAQTGKGYGQFWDGKRHVRAHRWAYEQEHGPIPEGMVTDHLCRVRLCVRVAHLEVVTSQENGRRGTGQVGLRSRQTHCWHGHEFNEANTRIRPDGTRACRACQRLRLRKRRAA